MSFIRFNNGLATLACAGAPDPIKHLPDGNSRPFVSLSVCSILSLFVTIASFLWAFVLYSFLLIATLACAGAPDPVEHLRDGNPAPLLQGGEQLDQHQPPNPTSIQRQNPESTRSTFL